MASQAESELHQARQAIFWIDCQIDRNHREMRRRHKIDLSSFTSWGNAWRKEPRLARREHELYDRRYDLVADRSKAEAKIARQRDLAESRRLQTEYAARRCPSCGGTL